MTKPDTLELQVFHAGFYLPICHPEICNTWNKLNHPNKEKKAYLLSKRWRKRSQAENGRESNKVWQSIYGKIPRITLIQQINMKRRIELTCMFIQNENYRHENIPTQQYLCLSFCSLLESPGTTKTRKCERNNSTMSPIISGLWYLKYIFITGL